MNTETLPNPETQPEFDTTSAIAEISSELFGQDNEEGTGGKPADSTEGGQEPDSSSSGAVEKSPDPQAEEGENSEAVQELGAPKTWSKEALAEWAGVPPRVQQEIAKREEDFLKGITQYKASAEVGQRYDSVVEPYRAMLAAENVDPVQLFQSFSANHYLLSRGTPQQKIDIAANLISAYGIDFSALANHLGNQNYEAPDPQILALQREIQDLKNAQVQQQTAATAQLQEQITAEVNTFAADPAHPYFDELVDDIQKLLSSGLATDLPDAYARAVYANPVTRQKELDRLTAEARASGNSVAQTRVDKIARASAADVKTTPTPRNGTVPLGSIDDTLNETLAAIAARG